jgi:hypothetical protein
MNAPLTNVSSREPSRGVSLRESLASIVARSADPIAAVERMGQWLAKSGLFGCDRVEQGYVITLTCVTEGLSPLEFRRVYDIVGSNFRMKAAAAHAHFHARGGTTRWVDLGLGGDHATAVFGWKGQEIEVTYTLAQARQARLIKPDSGWIKNPDAMLRARVITNGVGLLCPEISAGEYESEDTLSQLAAIVDFQPPPPPPPVSAAPPSAQPNPVPAAAPAPVPAPAPIPSAPAADVRPAAETPARVTPAPIPEETRAPAATPNKGARPEAAPAVLPADIQEKLIAIIEPQNMPTAVTWLIKQGWLGPDQPIEEMSLRVARTILNSPEKFRRKALGLGDVTTAAAAAA